jgi:hypothetical protein
MKGRKVDKDDGGKWSDDLFKQVHLVFTKM